MATPRRGPCDGPGGGTGPHVSVFGMLGAEDRGL